MRLVNADALLENAEYDGHYRLIVPAKKIEKAPTIEAEPVRHGEWIIERSPVEAEIKCSECDYSYIDADSYAKAEYNYCPNCGAKMDRGD